MLTKLIYSLLLLLLSTTAYAQIPRTITYQGQALQNGQPLTGSHNIEVSFYAVPTGGSPVYTEQHTNVAFDNGIFKIEIGSASSIPELLPFDETYYLGIRIDGGTAMSPRTKMTSSPYSIYANRAGEAERLASSATGVVTSINNQSGALTFEGAGNTTVTSTGNTVTISSTGGSGATGIQGVQSVNASLSIQNPNGPIANLSINEQAVKTNNLFDGAVTTGKLANESVATPKIIDGAVTTPKLADGGVTTQKISDNAITTAKLGDQSVTSIKIADLSIATTKLEDAAVTSPKLAGNAVEAAAIADGAVGTSELAASGVTSEKILDATIGTADLAALAVTAPKIGSLTATNGQILTANGSGGAAWLAPASLALPYSGISNVDDTAFAVVNTGANIAGSFRNTLAGNNKAVLQLSHAGTGAGITVQLTNNSNGARGIDVTHTGVGPGIFSSASGGNAIWGISSSISSAGVIADNTFGEAVVGRNRGGNGVGAVVGRNDSSGYGVRGFNTKTGIGVLGQSGISGGSGIGGKFENVNAANASSALEAVTNGNGSAAWLRSSSTSASAPLLKLHVHPSSSAALLLGTTWNGSGSPTNVVRIDKTGKGFFNGGTQNSGADVAEAFAVLGNVSEYEPGDVLVIAPGHSRTVTKATAPYSTAVLGVHATKPGVLLTEREVDSDLSDLVPMGVVGVLQTKVTNEGGKIKAGDLLVTSSTIGHAMKADSAKLGFGMVLGKALEDFDGASGVIQVFVNVK